MSLDTPARTSRKAQAAATRKRLLKAAMAQFTREPYDAVSVNAVAAAAGTAAGLVFHYFSSKRGLYLEALREAARQLDEAHRFPQSGTPGERCRGMLLGHFAFMRDHPELALALFRGGIGADPEAWAIFEEGRMEAIGYLCRALGLEGSQPALKLMMRSVSAAFDEATLQWIRQADPMPLEALVEALLDVMAAAIRSAARLDPALRVEDALRHLEGAAASDAR